ncbi:MAG: UbiA family prenyltransferase [archaeon]|nr:UbiA family prenyltransferase [archaeon]
MVRLRAKALGVVRMLRLKNCFMIGFGVVVGETIALGGGFNLTYGLLGFFTAFLLMAATMALNDYFDLEVDLVNNPTKPIPSGIVSLREAVAYAFILGFLSLALAWLINPYCMAIALSALLLMVYYNAAGKKTGFFGNLVVSCCVALPFIFGGFAVGDVKPVLWFFTLLAFLSNVGREVAKGIVDVRGDAAKNIRTIAATHGGGIAAKVAVLFFISSVALSPLPWMLGLVSILYLPFVLLSDAGFIYSSLSLLRDFTPKNAESTKNMALVWMLLGLVAFLAGSYRYPIHLT